MTAMPVRVRYGISYLYSYGEGILMLLDAVDLVCLWL